jgi:hypothetical protein
MIREFSGTWPDGTEPTYYVVACGELDRAYCIPDGDDQPPRFPKKQKLYLEILTSAESASGSVRS